MEKSGMTGSPMEAAFNERQRILWGSGRSQFWSTSEVKGDLTWRGCQWQQELLKKICCEPDAWWAWSRKTVGMRVFSRVQTWSKLRIWKGAILQSSCWWRSPSTSRVGQSRSQSHRGNYQCLSVFEILLQFGFLSCLHHQAILAKLCWKGPPWLFFGPSFWIWSC